MNQPTGLLGPAHQCRPPDATETLLGQIYVCPCGRRWLCKRNLTFRSPPRGLRPERGRKQIEYDADVKAYIHGTRPIWTESALIAESEIA